MKKIFLFVPLIALCWLAGCAGSQVTTDYDRQANFGQYKTYSWATSDIHVGNNPMLSSSLITTNIRETIEQEFEKRGLALSNDQPDLLIAFHTYTQKKTEKIANPPSYYPNGYNNGWNYYPNGYGNWPYRWNNSFSTVTYTEGTLIIDVADAQTHQLIWRGSIENEVEDPSLLEGEISKGVKLILKQYPIRPIPVSGHASR